MDSNSVSQQDMLTVLNVYQQLVTDSTKLAQGDKFLEQALNQINNFASTSIKIFVQKEQNMQMRIYIGALIKNMLREYWQSNQALADQKKEIREILLHGLLMNVGDLRIIEIIALIITEIMVFDGVELWASSLKQIIDWMKSEDLERVNTGLELFCTIFSKVSEKYRNEKILPESFSLTPLIPKLMQALLQILVNLRTLNETQREKLFVLLYLTITSFAYADGSDNRLVAQCFDETFKDWMNLFISTLQTDLKSHITIKRYILKIMNVIFRDFTYYARNAIAIRILPIWKFMNSILPLYIWTCVYGIQLQNLDNNAQPIQDPATILIQQGAQQMDQYGSAGLDNLDFRFLEEEDECLNEIEGLTLNAIELLATLVIKEDLYMLVKHALFPIINALAHFILLSKQQEKLWIHEPNQFITDDEDEANMKSLRALAHNLIFQLIEKFQDQTTQALMIVAEKFMTNQDQAQTVQVIQEFYDKGLASEIKMGQSFDFTKERLMEFIKTSNFDCTLPDHAWKKREVGLLLLGSFSDDIIDFQYKHTSSFDISSLIQNLISDIQIPNSNPILIAKSLWCVTRFSEVIAQKHTELFLPLFKVAMSCLSNIHQFPVRLTAVKSIGVIAHKIKQYQQQLPDRSTWVQYGIEDVSILVDVFDILTYVNVETVHIILDTLVYLNKLSKVYIPEIANLGARSILQIFTLQHNDQMINRITMELITQLSEDPVSFNIIFQNAFSSFILDSFNLIKHHIAENSNLTQIRQQDLSLMASIFDVTSIFVKNCQDNNAKESLIKLLPPLLNLMIVNEECTLQQHASICLKNFIKVADQYIIKNQLVKDVLQVIMKLLQVPTNSQFESNSTYSGNLCMIAFHNLLGGSADPEILKQVIYKIFRSKLATTVQGLVLVWARMIINNPIESVNFLYSFSVENRFALKVLIDKWLLQQAAFRGKYTKNTTLLALTKLFLLKDNRIETLVAIAYNPSHQNVGHDVSAPLKILSTLIRGLDNEMIPQRKEQDYIRDAQNYIKDGEDERLEVDDDENGDYNDQFQEENEGKVEVDMNIIHDEEENQPRQFAVGGEKAGGLAEFETGSTNYMTEGFEFGYDDGEECDETTEEDLEYLKDQYIQVNTAEMLKQFFNDLAKNDPKYFAQCLKHLLKEDINLLQKYINLKNIEQLHSQQIY
ncbi:importin-beta amine-terminal domain protein (macronuclear) [Tetrahymena thermophila SB210]|uniref:Importin-beta amine-terminal domain protein n=1 Tax=Tetrahymena thermophila (strain SB210) TaxID=312017 RepID=Q23AR9_TETTS|nr:importin-beta amine-terminal domain protein [Tetrahymena thermophila SB210]EAR93623.2 importin-beta amine-terminal domain protein [Tetrahymena thermophila SB210]|eukprot:XP_001013868.2 importin-beta amine-terminal domain protein [Tetrahymena thermophila SB210]